MNIKTKLTHVDQVMHDRLYENTCGSIIAPDDKYILHFYGDSTKVSIELSSNSELYDYLEFLGNENMQNFVFNIQGKHVDTMYEKQIAKLKQEKVDILGKISGISEISENRLSIILDQQTSVNELYALKLKWWYRLFNWMGL